MELRFLAAAAQKWVSTDSTFRGHVAYVPTVGGLAELAKRSPSPRFGKPPREEAAAALYRTEQDLKLRELHTMTPVNTQEIGPCPLMVSGLLALQKDGDEDALKERRQQPLRDGLVWPEVSPPLE